MTKHFKQQLVKDLKLVADDIKALAQEASAGSKEKLAALAGRADHLRETAIEAGCKAGKRVDTKVKENPWQAVAVIGAVGILIGTLLGRRK